VRALAKTATGVCREGERSRRARTLSVEDGQDWTGNEREREGDRGRKSSTEDRERTGQGFDPFPESRRETERSAASPPETTNVASKRRKALWKNRLRSPATAATMKRSALK
jgi:hypothetical protein